MATACYLARIKGVKSAMPMYKALNLCPKAVVIKPNMKKYRDASQKIHLLMNEITPLTEPISLDEAFLDLSGTKKLHKKIPAVLLAELSKKIIQEVGISVSIGLSYNKFLAKICSDLDKPKGFSLLGKADSKKFLATQPVEILWGVGKILKRKLNDDGIKTIGQIREVELKEIINRYGSIGSHIYLLSEGKDSRKVIAQRQIKSISHETTFDNDEDNKKILEKKLWLLCEKVSKRSKDKGLGGQTITLKLKTKDFKLITRSCTVDEPTQMGELIFQHSKNLLDRENKKQKYRLIGVGISNLKDSELCDIYDLINTKKTKNAKIEYATSNGGSKIISTKVLLDSLNTRYGILDEEKEKQLFAEVMKHNPQFRTSQNNADDKYLGAIRLKHGYATTCHKAQGGEWDNVLIHPWTIGKDLKWTYTAITRAKREVYSYAA